MARKNTVRRYPPVDYYDVTAVERWLERMALNGLFLVRVERLFAHFTREAPRPARYQAEPLNTRNPISSREQMDYYASCGWVYVDTVMKLYRIYRADDPETEELHTDPVVLAAAMEDVTRRQRGALLLCLSTLVFLALIYAASLLLPPSPLLFLLQSGGVQGLLVLANLLLLLTSCRSIWGLHTLQRRLGAGEAPRRDDAHFCRARRANLGVRLAATALIACFLAADGYSLSQRWSSRPVEPMVLSLTELEGTDIHVDATARHSWSLLGEHCTTVQILPRADDGAFSRLDAYLFRLNLPFLAGPLLRELEDRYGGGEAQILLLHDGPYVACLVYDGPGELGRFAARSARWSLGD